MSRLRKSVDSIRVLKRRSRPQSVEAALASSGVESSGDAATSNRGHEFLQVSVDDAKREFGVLIMDLDVILDTEMLICYFSLSLSLCGEDILRVGTQSCQCYSQSRGR